MAYWVGSDVCGRSAGSVRAQFGIEGSRDPNPAVRVTVIRGIALIVLRGDVTNSPGFPEGGLRGRSDVGSHHGYPFGLGRGGQASQTSTTRALALRADSRVCRSLLSDVRSTTSAPRLIEFATVTATEASITSAVSVWPHSRPDARAVDPSKGTSSDCFRARDRSTCR